MHPLCILSYHLLVLLVLLSLCLPLPRSISYRILSASLIALDEPLSEGDGIGDPASPLRLHCVELISKGGFKIRDRHGSIAVGRDEAFLDVDNVMESGLQAALQHRKVNTPGSNNQCCRMRRQRQRQLAVCIVSYLLGCVTCVPCCFDLTMAHQTSSGF